MNGNNKADRNGLTASELAAWSGGHWENVPTRISWAIHDSRMVEPTNLYVALAGEHHDGHDFVLAAATKGAAAAMVRADWKAPPELVNFPLLRVEDPLLALGRIALNYKREIAPLTVGISGSVGKTTVKSWTAALLERHCPTASTWGNYNTEVGLPLSLLRMPSDTRVGIFELGMSHPGEIKGLCQILEPRSAIITAIGPSHIEHFGTIEAIANEKADLLKALPATGFAVVQAESPWLPLFKAASQARLITVSLSDSRADFFAEPVNIGKGSFRLRDSATEGYHDIEIGLPGRHMVLNALYAWAAARGCGATTETLLEGIRQLPHLPMRWELSLLHGVNIVNDAYNASPQSLIAALDAFESIARKRRWLVLGEMRELGDNARQFHYECGQVLAKTGWEALVAVGEGGRWMAEAAQQAGFKGAVWIEETAADAGRVLAGELIPGDWVLLKGSRGVGMEQAITVFNADFTPPQKATTP